MTETPQSVADEGAPSGPLSLAIDLHAHTRFFHGFEGRPTVFDPVGARLLSMFARRRGLDAVAVTNHDYHRQFAGGSDPPFLLPGIEITTTRGHVLVIGPDPPDRTTPGTLTPEEAVALAHERDCAAVIPHPYRSSTVRDSRAAFDAIEINGKHPDAIEQVRALAAERGIPIVGGSDAHYPFEVGRAYTVVQATAPTPSAVVDAIRAGRVRPRVERGPVASILQWAYRYTHRYKARRAAQRGQP